MYQPAKIVCVVRLGIMLGMAIWMSACAKNNAAVFSAPVASISSQSLYQELTRAPLEQRLQAIKTIRAMSMTEYYKTLESLASNEAVAVDGVVFRNAKRNIQAKKAAFLALSSKFATVGALWAALGVDPATHSVKDLSAHIARLGGVKGSGLSLVNYDYKGDRACQTASANFAVAGYFLPAKMAAQTEFTSGVTTVDVTEVTSSPRKLRGGLSSRTASGYEGAIIDGSTGNALPGSSDYLENCFRPSEAQPTGVVVQNPDGTQCYGALCKSEATQ